MNIEEIRRVFQEEERSISDAIFEAFKRLMHLYNAKYNECAAAQTEKQSLEMEKQSLEMEIKRLKRQAANRVDSDEVISAKKLRKELIHIIRKDSQLLKDISSMDEGAFNASVSDHSRTGRLTDERMYTAHNSPQNISRIVQERMDEDTGLVRQMDFSDQDDNESEYEDPKASEKSGKRSSGNVKRLLTQSEDELETIANSVLSPSATSSGMKSNAQSLIDKHCAKGKKSRSTSSSKGLKK
jgi:hypothetical protein